MNRANLAPILSALLVLPAWLAAQAPAPAAPPPENLEVDSVQLAEELYFLRSNTKMGNPGSVVLLGPEGTVLVDPNLARVGPSLEKEITRLGGGPVRYVFCTHYHGDHAEGMKYFGPKATIITPHHQRERLMRQPMTGDTDVLPPEAWPALTFEGSFTLRLNGGEVQATTLPNIHGHTDGDTLVYFPKQKVLCVGDYLFVDKFPIVDVAEGGGDLEGYLTNIRYILEHYPADTKVVPGHGYFRPHAIEPVTMEHYRANLAALERSIAVIRAHMTPGRTREQVIADGLPEEFAPYDVRPRYVPGARWIGFVFDYYSTRGAAKQAP